MPSSSRELGLAGELELELELKRELELEGLRRETGRGRAWRRRLTYESRSWGGRGRPVRGMAADDSHIRLFTRPVCPWYLGSGWGAGRRAEAKRR